MQAAGLVFVGPEAQTIRRMGDKAEARRTAMAAGVPVVPGSPGELGDLDAALACAEEVGYPLLVKASAGGGGRGIRIAHDADELRREFPIAQREAQAAFGSPAVYLERFIRQARHIEVQILGDGERAVHLFERECSLQRRRQKVFEEAPSAALDGAQRQALCESAVRLAQSLGYRGAGTLEYLFDAHSGEFFFIEMNTRIQVEHPVSEMVTGIDLVQAMLRIAAGEALPWRQEDIRLNGAALEMRINAEDPARNFFPSPGTVERRYRPRSSIPLPWKPGSPSGAPPRRRFEMHANIRYSFGGDEHLFAEVAESMSLEAFFRGMAITRAIETLQLPGVLDVCLANASFQVRFDPDRLAPQALLETVRGLEAEAVAARSIETRIVEVPVLYNDPWTHETLMRFRDRHQDPDSTDLEYAARINGYADVQAFIQAHSGTPWFVSMVGFVAGLPFMYQMVERERQLQVPKYLRPRIDTPKLTLGHGGCFGCIYSVRGAGGYQMFGVTPAPIFDPRQGLPYLEESMVFFRAGDIVQFRPIERTEYERMAAEVEAGTFDLRIRPVSFDLDAFLADPRGCTQRLQEVLYVD